MAAIGFIADALSSPSSVQISATDHSFYDLTQSHLHMGNVQTHFIGPAGLKNFNVIRWVILSLGWKTLCFYAPSIRRRGFRVVKLIQ